MKDDFEQSIILNQIIEEMKTISDELLISNLKICPHSKMCLALKSRSNYLFTAYSIAISNKSIIKQTFAAIYNIYTVGTSIARG